MKDTWYEIYWIFFWIIAFIALYHVFMPERLWFINKSLKDIFSYYIIGACAGYFVAKVIK